MKAAICKLHLVVGHRWSGKAPVHHMAFLNEHPVYSSSLQQLGGVSIDADHMEAVKPGSSATFKIRAVS